METIDSAPARQRLAAALRRLQQLQEQGLSVFRSADFTRTERQALSNAGFLRMVVKGWYLTARPGDEPGDSTPWYAVMQDFIAGYCEARFGDRWHVAPAYSLQVHAGATALPKQAIVHSPLAKNSLLALPGDCSLVDYLDRNVPEPEQLETRNGLRILPLSAALVRVPEAFFANAAADAQIVLAGLVDVSALNRELLAGNHSVVAGRLAGALRTIGRDNLADDVQNAMRAAGYSITETNPFLQPTSELVIDRSASPYVLRLQLMWRTMRDEVLRHFPDSPGLPTSTDGYLHAVQEGYASDAYHSLSIEGYRVTEELIERVATGVWNPALHAGDANASNAMAAHGYWRAFESVQTSLRRILDEENAGDVVRAGHADWFRELFRPSVEAGILAPADLAGYRNAPVYIRNASHVPPPHDAVRDMMPALFDLIAAEPSAAVRAVLGHFCFVFIHPYMDGNGRVGRFLMNAMLASGGFPWTIIRVEWRDQYLAALDAASARSDIAPLSRFIAAAVLGETPDSC